ncbi:diguanylate cyclase [Rhodopseudomonas sp. B29]|uniref:GGDEF domain-containing protein n=1 Tax=Rhodopseudomonas sp. B29 TaxID=95607 RepID=UPI00034DA32E|nr:GGDEF domain-containing protein [Rhodopseudomonas sp. B29]
MVDPATHQLQGGEDRRRPMACADPNAGAGNRLAQRRSLVFNLVLNLAAIGLDVAFLQSHLTAALVLRLGVVTPLALIGLALTVWAGHRTLLSVVHAAMLLSFIATVTIIGTLAPEPYAGRYMMVALFMIFCASLLSGLPWRIAQVTTVVAVALYMLIVASALSWPPAWSNLDLVGSAVIAGAMALRVRRRKDQQIAEFEEIRRNDALLKEHLREANEALGQLSNTDALTGAFNRRYLDELIEHDATSLVPSLVPSLGQGVLMIDVDHFKLFNDHGGHAAGDHCLQQIVTTIRHNVRPPYDIVVRYGGEEFAVIMPGMDEPDLLRAAERLCSAVSDLGIPHPALGPDRVVTVSIGAALAAPGESLADAILHADDALYRAKHRGRNRVTA